MLYNWLQLSNFGPLFFQKSGHCQQQGPNLFYLAAEGVILMSLVVLRSCLACFMYPFAAHNGYNGFAQPGEGAEGLCREASQLWPEPRRRRILALWHISPSRDLVPVLHRLVLNGRGAICHSGEGGGRAGRQKKQPGHCCKEGIDFNIYLLVEYKIAEKQRAESKQWGCEDVFILVLL